MSAVDEKFMLTLATRFDQVDARLGTLEATLNTVHEDVRMRNAYVNQSEAALRRASRHHALLVEIMTKRLRRMMIIVVISTATCTATGFAAGIVWFSNAITWGWFR